MDANVTISAPVAKYLAAILLDPKQHKPSGDMAALAQRELLGAMFGANARYIVAEDARGLVYEAMRESVWRANNPDAPTHAERLDRAANG